MFKRYITFLLLFLTSVLYSQKIGDTARIMGTTVSGDTIYIEYVVDFLEDLFIVSDGDTIKLDPHNKRYMLDMEVNDVRIVSVDTTGKLNVRTASSSGTVNINAPTGYAIRLINNDATGSPSNYIDLYISSDGNYILAPSGDWISLQADTSKVRMLSASDKVVAVDTVRSDVAVTVCDLYWRKEALNRFGTNASIYMPNDTVFCDAIGIGTVSPSTKFHIDYTLSDGMGMVDLITLGDSSVPANMATVGDGIRMRIGSYSRGGAIASLVDNSGTNWGKHWGLAFYTYKHSDFGGTGLEEAMRIASNGYVGNGTTDPDTQHHIASTSYPQETVEHTEDIDYTQRGTDEDGNYHIIPSGGTVYIDGNLEADNVTGFNLLDADLTSDSSYSGSTVVDTVGVEVFAGDLIRIMSIERYGLTDADTDTTMLCVGLVCSYAAAGQPTTVLKEGYFRLNSWNWTPSSGLTGTLFVDDLVAGGMVVEANKPNDTGDIIQSVGYVKAANIIYFRPSVDWVEVVL